MGLILSNDIYLCICNINTIGIICDCKSFNSFIEANNYYIKNNENNENNKHISTMISTEYIPHLFKKYYLNYKLSKLLLKCNLDKKKNSF
jgi:hypothetical protein